jgi:hypothetical protein
VTKLQLRLDTLGAIKVWRAEEQSWRPWGYVWDGDMFELGTGRRDRNGKRDIKRVQKR